MVVVATSVFCDRPQRQIAVILATAAQKSAGSNPLYPSGQTVRLDRETKPPSAKPPLPSNKMLVLAGIPVLAQDVVTLSVWISAKTAP